MKKNKILDKRRLMKNTTTVMSILVVALLVCSGVSAIKVSEDITFEETITKPLIPPQVKDISPNIEQDSNFEAGYNSGPQTQDLWDVYFDFDVGTASGANGNTGGAFIDEYFYTCRWASSIQHQYDSDGNMLKEFSVAGVSNVRDFATDNEYLYGGAAGGTIWMWDPVGETLEETISGGFQARALGYDPIEELFYASNWGDPCWVVDRSGAIQETFNFALTTSTYGIAVDNWRDGGPYLWVHDQGGTGSVIHQWDLAAGEFTGEEHDIEEDIGQGYIAGGISITEHYEPGWACIVAVGQGVPDWLVVYESALTVLPEHDVGIKAIIQPETGTAVAEIPMQVEVKNYGNNTETTDVQMNIIRCEGQGDFFVDENFSGTFPPANWTTDYWQQSFTNYAGALSPEAHCYYYTQRSYPYYDYYDNFIQGPAVNCTGWEKVNLRFAFSADVQSSCYLYLKYRKNFSSPWVDVTPWDVPVTEDFTDWFEIGCYGFGEDLGDEFQFKWEYIGYYSYFRNWYLDDVTLEGCGCCAEYSEIVEDVVVPQGESVIVDFPDWTSTNWQNESSENDILDYPVEAITLLDDQVEANDVKWKLIYLWFPWMDDVGAFDIAGPETGPGQTFDVDVTVSNVGQNDECCFKTYFAVAEIDYSNPTTVWTENFDSGYGYTEPTGWTTGASSPYAWYCYYFSYYIPYPYGSYRSMRCYWYYSNGAELISPEVDTTGSGALEATWGMMYDHFTGDYELYVHIRPDPDSYWGEIQPWDNPVNANIPAGWQTADASIGVGPQTQIKFSTGGYYFNMDYWFLDNLEYVSYDIKEPEYATEFCVEEIAASETLVYDIGTWTPEFLAAETTGQKTYLARAWTDLEDPLDKNPANDLWQLPMVLDFWHDVGVKEITSPAEAKGDEIIFSQPPIASGGHGPFSDAGTNYRCYENFWDLDDKIGKVHWWGLCGYGSGQPSAGMTFQVAFCADNGGVPDYTNHLYEFDGTLGTEITFEGTGVYYFGYELFFFTLELTENVDMSDGWVSFYKTSVTSEVFAMIDAEIGSGDNQAYQAGIGTIFYDLAFELVKGGLGVDVYKQPGSENIDAVVENLGTFNELGLIAYAEIYEHIDDCENGTLVYEDNITNIDLDDPLGGTETLNFDSFGFPDEGFYQIIVNLPDMDDDFPDNNIFDWGIGVDDTPPTSTHSYTPATPDGENGYHVSDVEVTVGASDPSIGCEVAGSGVKEIKYKIGTGSWQTIPGAGGSFTVDVDGNDLPIQYYAIDNVGNEEATNSFTIDMDQTIPDMEPTTWENPEGMIVIFTAEATDATADMDRVEMYINEGLHETVTGTGPTYTFEIEWTPTLKTVTFTFIHYDRAGNFVEYEIEGSGITSYPVAQSQPKANTVARLG
jgi:uncharacterized protein YxeA